MPTKWQKIEDLRPHLDPLVEELGRMPSQVELKERGRGYLVDAVQKFGHQEVAKALGYLYEGRNSWVGVEDLRPHLDPIVAELGRMPNHRELSERDRSDLRNILHKFGGIKRSQRRSVIPTPDLDLGSPSQIYVPTWIPSLLNSDICLANGNSARKGGTIWSPLSASLVAPRRW